MASHASASQRKKGDNAEKELEETRFLNTLLECSNTKLARLGFRLVVTGDELVPGRELLVLITEQHFKQKFAEPSV
jgi:hypothetical protein